MMTLPAVSDGREFIDESEADEPPVFVSVESVGVLSIDDISDADVVS